MAGATPPTRTNHRQQTIIHVADLEWSIELRQWEASKRPATIVENDYRPSTTVEGRDPTPVKRRQADRASESRDAATEDSKQLTLLRVHEEDAGPGVSYPEASRRSG